MKPMAVVLSALDGELSLFWQNVENLETSILGPFNVHRGRKGEWSVVGFATGVGKVRASAGVQFAIDKFTPNLLIFVGLAGALAPFLEIGDIVIAQRILQLGFTIRAFSGRKSEDESWIETSRPLVEVSAAELASCGLNIKEGSLLTSDSVVVEAKEKHQIYEKYEAECIDMESAAVAIVCRLNRVPYIVLRQVSDKADDRAPIDFWSSLNHSGEQLARAVNCLLNSTELQMSLLSRDREAFYS